MATQVTVTGTLKDAAGGNMTGTVTFTPAQPLYDLDGNLVVTTVPVVASLSSGSFTATIYATDDPDTLPANATYLIAENLTDSNGRRAARRYRAEIPAADTSLRYEDISEAHPPRGQFQSYATAAALAGVQATAEAAIPSAEKGKTVERPGQGRQHTEAMRGWAAALAANKSAGSTVRVAVIGDSIPELLAGWSTAAARVQSVIDGSQAGSWIQPSWALIGFDPTYVQEGTAGTIGLDMLGRILGDGDQCGSPSTEVFADRFDVYYTARSSGADLECWVDGVLVETIDTSLDEDGGSVASDTPCQRVQIDVTAGLHTFYVIADGGTVYFEAAYAAPSSGVEWYGFGRSGVTTPQIVTYGGPVAFVQAATDRAEPIDLILLGADTAEVTSDATWTTAAAAVTTLVGQLQDAAPNASIVYVIPHGHNSTATPAQFDAWADDWRGLCDTLGIGYVDLNAALGHVGNSYDPRSLSDDGVHLNAKGSQAAQAAILDVLLSRTTEAPARTEEVWLGAGDLNLAQGSPTQTGSLWYLDSSTDEAVNALVRLPDHWQTYNVRVLWTHLGGATGAGVVFVATATTVKDGAAVILVEAGGGPATVTAPASTIVKDSLIYSDIPVPTGGFLNISIRRDADNAADTLAVDAVIAGVRLVRAS